MSNNKKKAGKTASKTAENMMIVGGGLVGSLLAAVLADLEINVDVFESRGDMRKEHVGQGRSINLAMSVRGLHALQNLGIADEVMSKVVAMRGRVIHPVAGPTVFQRYGKDDSECIYSVSRADLNKLLMTFAEKSNRVKFHFHERLMAANLKTNELTFFNELAKEQTILTPSRVFGTDGSASALRLALHGESGFAETREELSYGYKELTLPAGAAGNFQMDKNGLHIWPRGAYMLIALPNCEGSFTCTLFLSHKGGLSFESLTTPEKVDAFFGEQFPDIHKLLPDVSEQFFKHPTGHMVTVKCSPWNSGAKAVLLGDAAHAIVPFFGQGMNCGFEDVTKLRELIEERRDLHQKIDWEDLFSEFSKTRKPNSDAIANLAIENFVEMRDKVGDPKFLLAKEVEKLLEKEFPGEYISRYRLVTFTRMAYSVAAEAGRIQDEFLAELCQGITSASQVDLIRAKKMIHQELAPLLKAEAARVL